MNRSWIVIPLVVLLGFPGCVSIYRSVKDKRDKNYEEGIKYYRQQNYERAAEKFGVVTDIDPDYKKSRYYLERSKRYAARSRLNIKQASNANYAKALNYKKSKQYESALTLFLQVQQQDPDYGDVADQVDECRAKLKWKYDWRISQAKKALRKKDYKAAYRDALKAKRYRPDGPEAASLVKETEAALVKQSEPFRKKADALFARGKFEEAKKQCEAGLAVNPADSHLNSVLTKTNERLSLEREYLESVKLFNKKNYYAAFMRFGALDAREKNYKAAPTYLKKSREHLLKNIGVMFNAGMAHYDKERYEEALAEWNKVVTIDPGHKKAAEYIERAKTKIESKKALGGGR